MSNKPVIVCASNRLGDIMVCSARHWDMRMRQQVSAINDLLACPLVHAHFEQGFIDQWGKFYNRQDAMKVVLESGQPFDAKRNSGNGENLYSEGLY